MPRHPGRQRGYALLIMMVILVMGSLYGIVSQLDVVTQKYARSTATVRTLVLANEALLGYAATYRDRSGNDVFGYLPCPDTTGDGNEAGNCDVAGYAAVGLLPYRTLGLPDLRDSDGVCLWYAVSGRFKAHPQGTAYNSVANPVPQPLNWDTQGQFSIRDVNGTYLVTAEDPDNATLSDSQGGAAAVIFATALPLATQSRTTSTGNPCQIDPSKVSDYIDGGYVFNTNKAITLTQGTPGSATNNDQLGWITPKEIFDRVVGRADFGNLAAAAPAGQVNQLMDEIKAILDKRLQDDIFAVGAGITPTPTSWSQPDPANTFSTSPYYVGSLQPSKLSGDVDNPRRLTQSTTTMSGTYYNYFDNWGDQFRQATCPSLDVPCLDINGGTANCRGVLMFTGRNPSGRPRPAADRTISPGCDWKCVIGKYFEDVANPSSAGTDGYSLLALGSGKFSGRAAYAEATTLTDASWSGATATMTTSAAHGFASGYYVTISGVSPNGYNGTYKIAVTDTTHFTVELTGLRGCLRRSG